MHRALHVSDLTRYVTEGNLRQNKPYIIMVLVSFTCYSCRWNTLSDRDLRTENKTNFYDNHTWGIPCVPAKLLMIKIVTGHHHTPLEWKTMQCDCFTLTLLCLSLCVCMSITCTDEKSRSFLSLSLSFSPNRLKLYRILCSEIYTSPSTAFHRTRILLNHSHSLVWHRYPLTYTRVVTLMIW